MNVLDLPDYTVEDESVLLDKRLLGYKQFWCKRIARRVVAHRIRGPAIIYKNGVEGWWREGSLYKPTAHEKMLWELRKKNECY